VLGNVSIGNYTSIGCGAIILPKIKIGNRVTVGAGAVVTKDIEDGMMVKGIPAK
jgi:acetyltransferase-like isoleucine patch superfamily enzyme